MKSLGEFTITLSGHPFTGKLFLADDGYGGMALEFLDTHEPIATLTSYIPGLGSDEMAIKDYSENEGCYQQLVDLGIIHPSHREVRQRFVSFPIVRLKMESK